tara:strand:+ start:2928 stop:3116 length:189 start_codon:yes stop_codon:yes gene_type:complete
VTVDIVPVSPKLMIACRYYAKSTLPREGRDAQQCGGNSKGHLPRHCNKTKGTTPLPSASELS